MTMAIRSTRRSRRSARIDRDRADRRDRSTRSSSTHRSSRSIVIHRDGPRRSSSITHRVHARVHAHRARRSIHHHPSSPRASSPATTTTREPRARARPDAIITPRRPRAPPPSSSSPYPPPARVVVVARDRARPSIVARAPERERSSKASRCTAAIRSRGRGGRDADGRWLWVGYIYSRSNGT